VVVVFAWSGGCAPSSLECDDSLKWGLMVTVTAADGSRVCDATVTVADGGFSATLEELNARDASSCEYVGAGERAGTYDVHVASAAGAADVQGVVVTQGVCHVEGKAVTVTLDASK
jgi:hypothetical protein